MEPWRWSPLRTILVDGDIFVIVRGGIAVFDDTTLKRLDWVPNS